LQETEISNTRFLTITLRINIVLIKVGVFAIFLLFVFMIAPAYANVTSLSLEKSFYTTDETFKFSGTQDGKDVVYVIIRDATGSFRGMLSDPRQNEGEVSIIPRPVTNFFLLEGIYTVTAFTDEQKEEDGFIIKLKFDGEKIFEIPDFVLNLKSISDKVVEIEKTISFTASLTDSSIEDAVFSLHNEPKGATIDPSSGKFVWTVSKSQGNIIDVVYNFDIVVKKGSQEDRENFTITINQAYVQPEIQPEPEKQPEPVIEGPDFGECGEGTKLINGKCTIVATKSKEGGGCLIATATYGSEMAPQVQLLREIRDNHLMNTDSGVSFMTGFNQFYYSFSPIIADMQRENPIFKQVVKIGITPLLSSLSIMSHAESESQVLGYGIGVILMNIGMYFVAPAMLFYGIRKVRRARF